jgi:HK97 family phage major capsid protein
MRLSDMIKSIVNNTVTDEQRAYIQGNSIDYRAALQATVEGQGEEQVPTFKQPLEVAIRNNTVLDKLGVRWFENVDGNIDLPKYNGSNVAWAGSENAEAADGAGTFEKVTLSPRRLTAYVDVSRQLINQSPEALEGILVADLARAIAEKIDMTVFGAGSGSTSEPAGIFTDASAGTLASMTFDDVLALENSVEEHNGTDFVFVTSPNVKYALRGIQTGSGLKMIYDEGEIDGRNTIVSNSVVKGGLACFDPRDLAVATFNKSGLIITVDTVTRAIFNEVRLVVNYLVDAKLAGDRIATEIFE